VQLLANLRVRAADSNDTLLRVIKNPVTQHLPLGCDVVGLEVDAELVDAFDLPARLGIAASGGGGAGAGAGGESGATSAGGGGGDGGGGGGSRAHAGDDADIEVGGDAAAE